MENGIQMVSSVKPELKFILAVLHMAFFAMMGHSP